MLGGAVAGGWYAVRWATSKLTSMAVEAGRRASDRQKYVFVSWFAARNDTFRG